MSLDLASVTRAKEAADDQAGVSVAQRVPWYLIDPTGDVIRKQRELVVTKERLAEREKWWNGLSTEERVALQQKEEATRNRAKDKELEDAKRRRMVARMAEMAEEERSKKLAERYAREAQRPTPWYQPPSWFIAKLPTVFPAWDIITSLALLFTAFATPYEVGFLPPPAPPCNQPLFVINRLIDGIFLVDMAMQFFLMERIPSAKLGQTDVEWDMSIPSLARKYFRGWFAIDVLSIMPSAFDLLPCGGGEAVGGIKSLRTVRALRLIKLVRLVRTSRVAARLGERVTWPVLYTKLMMLTAKILLVVHYMGCITAIMTTFAETPLNTWLGTFGYCTPTGFDEQGDHTYECVEPAYIYFTTIKWAMGLVAAQGLPIVPAPGPHPPYYSEHNLYETQFTVGEDIIVHVLKFFGILVWATTLAGLIKAISAVAPDVVAYEQDLDNLNRLCTHYHLPGEMSREFRRFIQESRASQKAGLLLHFYTNKLSPILAQRASSFINQALMETPLIRYALENALSARERNKREAAAQECYGFISMMMSRMRPFIYAPKDKPPKGKLYIITQGTALYKGVTLRPGGFWGELDVVMAKPKRVCAVASTHLHVQAITREDFQRLSDEYPRVYASVKRWVYWSSVKDFILGDFRKARAEAVKAQGVVRSPPPAELDEEGARKELLAIPAFAKQIERQAKSDWVNMLPKDEWDDMSWVERLRKVRDSQAGLGSSWAAISGRARSAHPTATELRNVDLAEKLRSGQTSFSVDEFSAFGVENLRPGHYIRVGEDCYVPAKALSQHAPVAADSYAGGNKAPELNEVPSHANIGSLSERLAQVESFLGLSSAPRLPPGPGHGSEYAA
jgi:hypothetical protein